MAFTVDAADLRTAIATAVMFAYTKDDELPALCGVHVEPLEGGIEFSATDRYVWSWETVKASGDVFGFHMPIDAVKRVVKLIPKRTRYGFCDATLTRAGDRITVTVGGDSVSFVSTADAFPNRQSIVKRLEPTPVSDILFTPIRMARVFKALSDRPGEAPVCVTLNGQGKPVGISLGDTFNALVMPTRETS